MAALIIQIYEATISGYLREPFTVADVKRWTDEAKVVKDDGKPYAPASIDAILSNSDKKNIPTTNRNRKMLCSRIRPDNNVEYWFEDAP